MRAEGRIASNPAPSLNLSHAVMVAAYEVFRDEKNRYRARWATTRKERMLRRFAKASGPSAAGIRSDATPGCRASSARRTHAEGSE